MKMKKTLLTLSLISAASFAQAGEVEVLHWFRQPSVCGSN